MPVSLVNPPAGRLSTYRKLGTLREQMSELCAAGPADSQLLVNFSRLSSFRNQLLVPAAIGGTILAWLARS